MDIFGWPAGGGLRASLCGPSPHMMRKCLDVMQQQFAAALHIPLEREVLPDFAKRSQRGKT